MDKILRGQSDSFDIREMVCSESEAEIYNKDIAEEAAAEQNQKKMGRRRTNNSV